MTTEQNYIKNIKNIEDDEEYKELKIDDINNLKGMSLFTNDLKIIKSIGYDVRMFSNDFTTFYIVIKDGSFKSIYRFSNFGDNKKDYKKLGVNLRKLIRVKKSLLEYENKSLNKPTTKKRKKTYLKPTLTIEKKKKTYIKPEILKVEKNKKKQDMKTRKRKKPVNPMVKVKKQIIAIGQSIVKKGRSIKTTSAKKKRVNKTVIKKPLIFGSGRQMVLSDFV